jgi:hypothetical protein
MGFSGNRMERWVRATPATSALKAFQHEQVIEAILGARSACAEGILIRLIRELRLEDEIPKNEWLRLLGSGFSTDLGL